MRSLKTRWFLVIFSFLCVHLACSKPGGTVNPAVPDCTTVSKTFSTDVSPIIQQKCALSGCHGPGSFNGPGSLTNYAEIFDARARIRPAVANRIMPKDGSLNNSQRNTILCWIDAGAPDN